MATPDRRYSYSFVTNLLDSIKGRTLGDIDREAPNPQFKRTETNPKITGIAGDVIEQSVFRYERDSRQECDIEIDGILTELKTTGVRIPKKSLPDIKGKSGREYYAYFEAKEGISITGVTFDPFYQTDFYTSHFYEKSQNLLIVFYEYKGYSPVPASGYAEFPVVDYCFNRFSESELMQLKSDWEIVRDYLKSIYEENPLPKNRNEALVGFTHILRPKLLLIELVPGFKKRNKKNEDESVSYQKPRYRLKKTFVDYIVKGHFNKTRHIENIHLKKTFASFAQLDQRCRELSLLYAGKTFAELKQELGISTLVTAKNFPALCVLRMFDANCSQLNNISDFVKAGIIAKTITLTERGGRTEDMKLNMIDFEEWADRDVDFEQSEIYSYFLEHSFLCPIFREHCHSKENQCVDDDNAEKNIGNTTFEGFKRFAFDDDFINNDVRRMWEDSRRLIHNNELEWIPVLDKYGQPKYNKSGSLAGAPNFPKSSEYKVFFRGGAADSGIKHRTESVNGIRMVPQFFWLKGSYIVDKLAELPFI